jgi:hypothetical protein
MPDRHRRVTWLDQQGASPTEPNGEPSFASEAERRSPAPGPACAVCSKPIDGGIPMVSRGGATMHLACWRDTATRELVERALQALEAARRRDDGLSLAGPCRICAQPIAAGEVAFWGRARLHRACLPQAPDRLPRRGERPETNA